MSAEGFEAMGKPIPEIRLTAGYQAVKEMVPDVSTEDAMGLVGKMANWLERDEPYKAQKAAKEWGLDLTGTYRLMAHLLA